MRDVQACVRTPGAMPAAVCFKHSSQLWGQPARQPLTDSRMRKSDAERAAKLAFQAKSAQDRSDHQLVLLTMKTHGSVAVQAMKQQLIQLGYIDKATEKVAEAGTKVKATAQLALENAVPETRSWK